jgi:hypothetical protein
MFLAKVDTQAHVPLPFIPDVFWLLFLLTLLNTQEQHDLTLCVLYVPVRVVMVTLPTGLGLFEGTMIPVASY